MTNAQEIRNYISHKNTLNTLTGGYLMEWGLVKPKFHNGLTESFIEFYSDRMYLRELESKNTGKLKFFKADLLLKGSYFQAMQDCTVVFHTASPLTSKITNPQNDLVDPAILDTRNVLQSVNETLEWY